MKKIILSFIILLSLQACQQTKQPVKAKQKASVKDSLYLLTDKHQNSEGPFLFNNGKQIIINWTQWDHDKKQNLLKMAYFDFQKKSFQKAVTVPNSKGLQMHAESMAKVGINDAGGLLAIYRKKSPNDKSRFGGLMYYTISNDQGQTWSTENRLVPDTTSTSQSFYDLALLPNKNIGLTWLDSRSKRCDKTLYFAQTNKDLHFDEQKPVAFSTCECCRTDLYVDDNGHIHIAYRNLVEPDEPGFDGQGMAEIRDMYYLKSVDTAKTFSKPITISKDNWHVYGCPHTGPSLAYNGKTLGAIWFTGAHHQPGLYFTTKTKATGFNPRKEVSVEGRHPQMIALNGNYYAAYEEYYEKDGKGYYKIVLTKITPDGQKTDREISVPLSNNNHPVLTPVDNNNILIAWVNTDTRHPKIVYKIVNIK